MGIDSDTLSSFAAECRHARHSDVLITDTDYCATDRRPIADCVADWSPGATMGGAGRLKMSSGCATIGCSARRACAERHKVCSWTAPTQPPSIGSDRIIWDTFRVSSQNAEVGTPHAEDTRETADVARTACPGIAIQISASSVALQARSSWDSDVLLLLGVRRAVFASIINRRHD